LAFQAKQEQLQRAREVLDVVDFSPREVQEMGVQVGTDGVRRNLFTVLGLPGGTTDIVARKCAAFADFPVAVQEQLAIEALYAPYLARQQNDAEILRRDEAITIPQDFDYAELSGLSSELCLKLVRERPVTLAQAARMEGMTPAALTLILAKVRQLHRGKAATA
jgi:tRNA uridine 5-carboxymethylaminomethyl modification enzyme